ncbi:MAG: response regulator transcription factor [Geminicoccaceae bacterium]
MAKIIVIEDEDDLRQLIVEELEDAGHQTLEACDGEVGLSTILAENPDVIISDIGMPRMDGFQLKQKLQTLPKFSPTPFLFVSALAFQQAMEKGLEIGADHFLTKPVNFDELLSRVEACAV